MGGSCKDYSQGGAVSLVFYPTSPFILKISSFFSIRFYHFTLLISTYYSLKLGCFGNSSNNTVWLGPHASIWLAQDNWCAVFVNLSTIILHPIIAIATPIYALFSPICFLIFKKGLVRFSWVWDTWRTCLTCWPTSNQVMAVQDWTWRTK